MFVYICIWDFDDEFVAFEFGFLQLPLFLKPDISSYTFTIGNISVYMEFDSECVSSSFFDLIVYMLTWVGFSAEEIRFALWGLQWNRVLHLQIVQREFNNRVVAYLWPSSYKSMSLPYLWWSQVCHLWVIPLLSSKLFPNNVVSVV